MNAAVNHPTDKATKNLILATLASVTGFWAWTVIAPLAASYTQQLELTSTQTALLVAMPILVGSLGRIVAGVLTDRFGGRKVFTAVLLASILPVLLVALGQMVNSYLLLVAAGFLLGVAGTVFAIGIPFVSSWYPPERRGFATGVFGAGMGGTAFSAFFTPRIVQWLGHTSTHLLIAGLLLVMAAVVWFNMDESPTRVADRTPVLPKLVAASRLRVTWQMCFLYAVVFGGFVSFSAYLPTYLRDVYDFDPTAAGTRTAGFALAAVLVRPFGGILADRIGPKPVVVTSLGAVAALAWLVSLRPGAEVAAGLTFLAMAAALGLGTGGVFAWVGKAAPAGQVGGVSGIVSAAGGLGGYFPPLVMGMTYNAQDKSYFIGLMLLVVTALVALAYTVLALGRTKKQEQPTAA